MEQVDDTALAKLAEGAWSLHPFIAERLFADAGRSVADRTQGQA